MVFFQNAKILSFILALLFCGPVLAFSTLSDHLTHDKITCSGEYKTRDGKVLKFSTQAKSETSGLPPEVIKLAVEGKKEVALGERCYNMDHALILRGQFGQHDLLPILERSSQVSIASSSYRLSKVDVQTANQVVTYVEEKIWNPEPLKKPSESDAYNLTFPIKADMAKDFRMIFGEPYILPGQEVPAELEISSLHFEDIQPSQLKKLRVTCIFEPRNR